MKKGTFENIKKVGTWVAGYTVGLAVNAIVQDQMDDDRSKITNAGIVVGGVVLASWLINKTRTEYVEPLFDEIGDMIYIEEPDEGYPKKVEA